MSQQILFGNPIQEILFSSEILFGDPIQSFYSGDPIQKILFGDPIWRSYSDPNQSSYA